MSEVDLAIKAWNEAPLHFKAMGGQVVGPLLSALAALQRDLNALGLVVAELKNERS